MFENVDAPDEKEKERKCVCAREREGGRRKWKKGEGRKIVELAIY